MLFVEVGCKMTKGREGSKKKKVKERDRAEKE